MRLEGVTRKQAFLTHLLISFSIFLVMLLLILFVWYPSFFLTLDGGDRGILTIFFVDVVLGPGLTLLVFKPGKPSLKFDMTVIVLLQALALGWGVSKVYEDRSVTAVFYLGKFECLGASEGELIDAEITSGHHGRQRLSFLKRPDTKVGYTEFLNEALQSGSSETRRYGDQFEPLSVSNIDRVRSYVLDIEKLREESSEAADVIERYIEARPGLGETYGLYPLSCRFGNAIAVLEFDGMMISDTFDVLGRKSLLRADATIPLR